MRGNDVHLSVIVPVWNGAERLPLCLQQLRAFLSRQRYSSELIVVDDHSDQEAGEVLATISRTAPGAVVLRNDRNGGKGYSIKRGMLVARGRYRVFTDADLAYPPDEINRILGHLEGDADVAVACRVLPESRYLMSPIFFSYLYTRHLMSRALNTVVRRVLTPGLLDTQAGLKGFTAEAATAIFSHLTIPRFGFDMEALFIAHKRGLRIVQAPVLFRYDDEPSTVRFAKDGLQMLRDLVRIRLNDWRHRYD